MGKFVSYTNFDYRPVDIIPVIASFDSEGHIAPLYLRIQGKSYKVSSYWVSSEFHNTMDFKCKIIDGDCLKPLALTFHREEGMWTIPKID